MNDEVEVVRVAVVKVASKPVPIYAFTKCPPDEIWIVTADEDGEPMMHKLLDMGPG